MNTPVSKTRGRDLHAATIPSATILVELPSTALDAWTFPAGGNIIDPGEFRPSPFRTAPCLAAVDPPIGQKQGDFPKNAGLVPDSGAGAYRAFASGLRLSLPSHPRHPQPALVPGLHIRGRPLPPRPRPHMGGCGRPPPMGGGRGAGLRLVRLRALSRIAFAALVSDRQNQGVVCHTIHSTADSLCAAQPAPPRRRHRPWGPLLGLSRTGRNLPLRGHAVEPETGRASCPGEHAGLHRVWRSGILVLFQQGTLLATHYGQVRHLRHDGASGRRGVPAHLPRRFPRGAWIPVVVALGSASLSCVSCASDA